MYMGVNDVEFHIFTSMENSGTSVTCAANMCLAVPDNHVIYHY